LPVVSTFGDASVMQVTGPLPHAEMKQLLRQSGVYLSTAKETFGIGILEALACGVPVLGYAIGGILDLVEHKRTGYLVEPGDTSGLEAGYHWLMENRADMQGAILGLSCKQGLAVDYRPLCPALSGSVRAETTATKSKCRYHEL
jgi:glycosyltransferase involved in cell wall biosynthesis